MEPGIRLLSAFSCTEFGWVRYITGPEVVHYGLTGGWVQKFKASYLAYFLQCALADYARGKHDGNTVPWP